MRKWIVAILIFNMMFVGCKKRHRRVIKELKPEVRKEVVDNGARPALKIPEKKPLTLHEIKFIIVNEDNIKDIFSDMDKNNEVKVLFALKGGQYKLLSLNVRTLINYIQYQKEVIIAYKDYYEGKEKKDEE